ncbi:hypothetical protein [Desulfonema limicola]|uniref:hypothetical protein n=1 Tax=Desulfonema limicola TaxID=45656 RepID=UPI001A9BFB69|nr:hypothetical protein [Desulfonema limicola]
MINFDVPFLPEPDYIRFLNTKISHIHSIHFSLGLREASDARHKIRFFETENLIKGLSQIKGPKKYALLNSRFHNPKAFLETSNLKFISKILKMLINASVLDGIVYTDSYYLKAFSAIDPETASQLEAVPGINCIADSFEKASAILEIICSTNFKLPEKFIIDRSVNRKMDELAVFSNLLRKKYPDMKIELLANEGCIYQCPFKLAHDSYISLTNLDIPASIFHMNQVYGCMDYFKEKPYLIFKSPFIRPEDTTRYKQHIDIIKICGRTLGQEFLKRTVSAYINQSFNGNLLKLMDSMEWMSDKYYVSNHDLPEDFFDKISSCTKFCESCTYCQNLFDSHVKKLEFEIKRFSDINHN